MVQNELAFRRVLRVSLLAGHTVQAVVAENSYRRLRSFFAVTQHWKTFDPFFQSKADTYRSSSGAIIRQYLVVVKTLF